MAGPKTSGNVGDAGAPKPNPAPLAVPPSSVTPKAPKTSGTATSR